MILSLSSLLFAPDTNVDEDSCVSVPNLQRTMTISPGEPVGGKSSMLDDVNIVFMVFPDECDDFIVSSTKREKKHLENT